MTWAVGVSGWIETTRSHPAIRLEAKRFVIGRRLDERFLVMKNQEPLPWL
jgi:hypothetical protein